MKRASRDSILLLGLLSVLATSCGGPAASEPGEPSALALVRAGHVGTTPIDREIRRLQRRVAEAGDPIPHLDRLGWAFVEKARREADPGYYRLAERSGAAMAELGADGPEAWLLRGHALHALHRFAEAEPLARALVDARGLAFDHGLLGDVLLDRGDLSGAIAAYQRMADLRPDSHALARAARVRFITGDLSGAVDAMALSARATSPSNGESFAWAWSQLAHYQLAVGDFDAALRSTSRGLRVQPDSAPALLARGRLLLALGRVPEALGPLRGAARRNPLPDVLWSLADALAETGHREEEAEVRARLLATGEAADPRGFAVYLATEGIEPPRALALARGELAARPDVYSHDALAWALLANARVDEARHHMRLALAAGTRDARLFHHAGVIAAAAGELAEAANYFAEAASLRHTLLPSQRADLEARLGPSRAAKTS